MRTSLLAIGASLFVALTSACGSSTEPLVSVESAGGTGAPADADECPANAPVRGVLKGDVPRLNLGGVFGQVRNVTDSLVWVWGQRKDGWSPSPCRVNPGMSASFGATDPRFANESFSRRGEFRIRLLVTSSQDADAPGTMVGYVWGPDVRPAAVSAYQTANGGMCDGDSVELKTPPLASGRKYVLKGESQGTVQVEQMMSDDDFAYEWMQTTDADWRWAYLGFSVLSIGKC